MRFPSPFSSWFGVGMEVHTAMTSVEKDQQSVSPPPHTVLFTYQTQTVVTFKGSNSHFCDLIHWVSYRDFYVVYGSILEISKRAVS